MGLGIHMQQLTVLVLLGFKHCATLSCRYSEAGLRNLTNLKNKDRAVAAILQHLARSGCLDVHIVFILKHEMGSAEGYAGDWCMDEVHDTDYKAKGWVSLDGSSPDFTEEVVIEAGEILQVRTCLSTQCATVYTVMADTQYA